MVGLSTLNSISVLNSFFMHSSACNYSPSLCILGGIPMIEHHIFLCAILHGMSDLLSPILFVMDNESNSFWCFVALTDRLGPNFNTDQYGMHSNF